MSETILLLDTEFIDLNKPFIYDISYTIARLENGIYEPLKIKNYIVKQVYDNKMLFQTAYYADKKPLYTNALQRKKYQKAYCGHIMNTIIKDIKKYNVDTILAYNISADIEAIRFTSNFFKTKNPMEFAECIDLMPLTQHKICNNPDYIQFANDNKLLTKNKYVKTNVETVVKFITKNPNFIAKHTATSDVYQEMKILNEIIIKGGTIEKLNKLLIKGG